MISFLSSRPRRALLALLSVLVLIFSLVPDASAAGAYSAPRRSSGKRTVNILLVGQDRQEEAHRTRADSMILCTFHPERREVTMTSFLRDLYVEIPGYGHDRLNAAYAYGGMDLLEETLSHNFGLKPDGVIEVDFSQFAQIIDRLGGVDMELRSDEAELIAAETGVPTAEGLQQLNGDQALSYARIRRLDADGDFSRTSRQRKVLTALIDRYRDAPLGTMLGLAKDLIPMLTTNLSVPELLGYGLELYPLLSDCAIRQQHIPEAGAYEDKTIDGMAVLVPDLEKAQTALRKIQSGG